MKKLMSIILVLLLLSCIATAEGMKPSTFLASRGLLVLDQNMLEAMSSDSEGISFDDFPDVTMCIFEFGEDYTPSIVVKDEVFYVGLDMTVMFGEGTLDAKAISQIFIDLCTEYPNYDMYAFGNSNMQCYMPDMSILEKFADVEGFNPDDTVTYNSMDEFLDAVRASVG